MHSWPTKELDLQVAAQLKHAYARERHAKPPFITISRQYGCDGHDLANTLVEKLNQRESEHPWRIFDRTALLQASDPSELNEDMLALLDNYGHSEFQSYIQEAIFGEGSQYKTIHNMAKVMRVLARGGHVVFVGGGAAVLTRDFGTGLHFRLFAPLEWRIRNHARRWNLDPAKARENVVKQQDKREAFLKTYLAESLDNLQLYDMAVNNARVPVAEFAELALAFMWKKQGRDH